MARQVLPWVGAAIGGYFGGPQGAQIGFMIGSLVGNAVDPQIIKGPRLGEAGLQTSAEGVFRPIVLGTGAVKGNIICRGNRQIKKHRESQGKGTGPKTETERVYWTYAIRICEANEDGLPINLLRVWQDEKLVYDKTLTTQIPEETLEFEERMTFYNGVPGQAPDPALEAFLGNGNAPSYQGTVYAVFANDDLTDTGERIPEYRWEVSTTTTESTWDYTWNGPYSIPVSANLGEGIYSPPNGTYVLANGIGRRVSIDGENFTVHGDALYLHVATDPISNRVVFINADNGRVEMSDDGGYTITATGPIVNASTGDFRFIPELGIYYHFGGLIPYKATSLGNVWFEGEPAYEFGGNNYWIWHPRWGFVVAFQTNNSVWESDSGMDGWVQSSVLPGPLGALQRMIVNDDTGDIIAFYTTGEVYRSEDGGSHWTLALNTSIVGVTPINGIYIPSLEIFYLQGLGSSIDNVWVSLDSGITWQSFDDEDMNGSRAFISAPTVNQMLAFGNELLFVANFVVDTTNLYLSDVVRFLCRRANVEDSKANVTNLTDRVVGIVFAEDYTCADAIRTMSATYFFDGAEYDDGTGYRLNFPKRGRPVELTITIDDLVDYPDKTVRQDAYERPRVLHMAFQSPTVGYAPAKASPSRFSNDVKVVGEVSTAVPVSFDDVNEAWRRADVMLKIVWTAIGGEEEFTLTDRLLRLVPSDAIGVYLRGQSRRMLITEQIVEDGIIRCKLLADRQSNYTSNQTGIPLPEPTPPAPSISGPTFHVPMDLPALNDNNDALISYQAATGTTDAWFGATVDRSSDGLTFQNIATFNENSIIGQITSPVLSASEHYTDTTNVVYVNLLMDDEIPSLTQQQFLSEGGSFALSWEDSTGRYWEVMQYRDAELDSSGQWRLSTLLRGRLNTEPAYHPIGAYLVLLDTVQSTSNVTAHLNNPLTYRATSIGRSPDASPLYTEVYRGNSQREWPVAHILIERAGDSISGLIIPRHRFGTEVNPVRSANWAGYAVTIQDSTDQVDGFDTLSATFSYDASLMTFPLQVTVRQLNRWTGAGDPLTEIVE